MSDKLEMTRSRYAGIEAGRRNGSQEFWTKLQQAFKISDAEMWKLTKKEEKQ